MYLIIVIIGIVYFVLRYIFRPDGMNSTDDIDEETMDFIAMDDLRRHGEDRHHDGP